MESFVIQVHFHNPINGRNDYFFGSLAAIYDTFSAEQIGCRKETLWNANIEEDKPKSTRCCVVYKHRVVRKKRSI